MCASRRGDLTYPYVSLFRPLPQAACARPGPCSAREGPCAQNCARSLVRSNDPPLPNWSRAPKPPAAESQRNTSHLRGVAFSNRLEAGNVFAKRSDFARSVQRQQRGRVIAAGLLSARLELRVCTVLRACPAASSFHCLVGHCICHLLLLHTDHGQDGVTVWKGGRREVQSASSCGPFRGIRFEPAGWLETVITTAGSRKTALHRRRTSVLVVRCSVSKALRPNPCPHREVCARWKRSKTSKN